MASQGDIVTANDINSVVSLANATLAKYGYSTVISGKTPLTDNIGGSVYSDLISGLTTINSNAYCTTPVSVTDLDNYNRGELVFSTLVTLLTTKYNTVNAGYCTCNCNYCSCDCHRCSCNCNYCSCDCNYCSCTCNKSWYCTGSSMHTCFAEDQLIHTSRGVIPVKDVTEGDFLYDAYTSTFAEVSSTWKIDNEVQSMARIGGQGFEIFVTKNHPLPLYNVNGDMIEVIQPESILHSVSDYMALYPIPQTKGKKRTAYNIDIDIEAEFLELLPYIVLFYKNDNFYCACDKILDRIESRMKLFMQNIKYERLTDGIHINRKDANIIEGRSLQQIFEMSNSHGLPNWIYDFDKGHISHILKEFEFIFDNMEINLDDSLMYQLRLLYAIYGKEFSLKEYKIYERPTYMNSFLLIPLTYIKLEDVNLPVYNMVMKNHTHACLVDIISMDGYNNGHL